MGMNHIAYFDGKRVEFDFESGDRIRRKGSQKDTGTVKEIERGTFVSVEWDEHCRDRLGRLWMPMSIERIPS